MNDVIKITKNDGTVEEVSLVTYLISDDKQKKFIVYFKDETHGDNNDKIIYISEIKKNENSFYIEEISTEEDWTLVQHLLKKIANAK